MMVGGSKLIARRLGAKLLETGLRTSFLGALAGTEFVFHILFWVRNIFRLIENYFINLLHKCYKIL